METQNILEAQDLKNRIFNNDFDDVFEKQDAKNWLEINGYGESSQQIKMNIIFIKKQSETMDYISFWTGRDKYTFEIVYNKEKDFYKYHRELFLNLKNQFPDFSFEKVKEDSA